MLVFRLQPPDSLMTYTYSISVFWILCHRDYCRRSSKVPCADHQVLPEYLERYIFLCIFGRKERENSSGLSIIDTDFYVYLSPDVLIHPYSFTFSWKLLIVLNSQNHFLCCKYVPLYLFLYIAYKGHHMLLSFSI